MYGKIALSNPVIVAAALIRSNGTFRKPISFPVIFEILSVASLKDITSEPTKLKRFLFKSDRITVCAAIIPRSIGEIVGKAVGPPPGTVIFPLRIIEKKISIAGFNVVNSLGTIGLAVAEKRMEDTTCHVVDSLWVVPVKFSCM